MISCRRPRASSCRRYTGSSSRPRTTLGARSRSSSVSNSGTTSSRDWGGSPARSTRPASRASTRTRNRSSVPRAIEMMYVRAACGAELLLDLVHGAKDIDRAACVVVERHVRPDERTSPRELAAQHVESRLTEPDAARDGGDGLRVHVRMVADIEEEAVHAVRLHTREQRIEMRLPGARGARFVERAAHEEQVALERLRARVRRGLRPRRVPRRARRSAAGSPRAARR